MQGLLPRSLFFKCGTKRILKNNPAARLVTEAGTAIETGDANRMRFSIKGRVSLRKESFFYIGVASF
jgi:hypothetical protein